jgi:hypothetical protein
MTAVSVTMRRNSDKSPSFDGAACEVLTNDIDVGAQNVLIAVSPDKAKTRGLRYRQEIMIAAPF